MGDEGERKKKKNFQAFHLRSWVGNSSVYRETQDV